MAAATNLPKARAQKLRDIMAPSDLSPYGLSSNSVSTEAGVHLTVFIKFLETGGSPDKFDAATGEYSTSHLTLLAQWIDTQEAPLPPRLRAIREGSESSSRSSRTMTPSMPERSRRRGAPTPLDDFLCSIDRKLLVYAERLMNMGVVRPGDIADLSLDDLAAAGIKKLHARKLKSDPLVFYDAQKIMEHVAEEGRLSGETDMLEHSSSNESVTSPSPSPPVQPSGGEEDVSSAYGAQLEELLAHAAELGLSGPELESAKSALAARQRGTKGAVPEALLAFLESLQEPKLATYGESLAKAGVTRPGDLAKRSVSDLEGMGVKRLHARRLKAEPAVFHDAIAIEEATEQP
mmetsp:Transcript_62975/g.118415  ORF Transcript_62975/g.118415 Transcript_62975/m.118415 type:complete len:348 (+) Transcript_62975:177-1220(+)